MTAAPALQVEPREAPPTWREAIVAAARRMAAITAAGALVGLLVGGVGGRLAMMLLARLNRDMAGLTSDDGFDVGQFTLGGSLNLLLGATLLGVLGAALYAVVRPLMIGPGWFRLLSIGLGPAVVVGEQLVHTDGVDFTLLEPVGLSISAFVLIPGLYAVALSVVAERWLAPDRFFARGSLPLALAPLLLFAPIAPVLALVALGWGVLEAVRRRVGGAIAGVTAAAWAGRAGLAAIFCVALVRLVDEVRVLT